MDTLEMTLGTVFAILIGAVAVFFLWRQMITLRRVFSNVRMPAEERRFLIRQSVRRTFSCCLLILLAVMVYGALFLDYRPQSKEALQFLSIYVVGLLLVLLAVMALAVLDMIATARHGIWQKRQLFEEQQQALRADLAEHRHRRAEMN